MSFAIIYEVQLVRIVIKIGMNVNYFTTPSQRFFLSLRFINPEPEYHKAFNDELSAFRDRIRARAKVRLEEAITKLEEVSEHLLSYSSPYV